MVRRRRNDSLKGGGLVEREVRSVVPDRMKGAFDGIVNQEILGASKHIALIGDMIASIAEEGAGKGYSSRQMVDDVKTVARYFIATRGEASQAVSNAIHLMIRGIDDCAECVPGEAARRIIEQKDAYAVEAATATERCVAYATKLASDMTRLFVYDYSSTVDRFLTRVAQDGQKREVVIPESRIIDGGKPFVATCLDCGYDVTFIPEAAMMDAARGCDAAFMGAETFYPDGTGFNTTGSDVVALICEHYGIPLYFITPMIKLDMRPVYGGSKRLVFDDLRDKMTSTWDAGLDASKVHFVVPELIGVPASRIRAFITELGIIPSGQLFDCSMRYSAYLNGEGECAGGEKAIA